MISSLLKLVEQHLLGLGSSRCGAGAWESLGSCCLCQIEIAIAVLPPSRDLSRREVGLGSKGPRAVTQQHRYVFVGRHGLIVIPAA